MARFQRAAEGTWTEHYPELGTGPVCFEGSISPAFYEREAIFKRAWLHVGRMEQLPRNGSDFTKDLPGVGIAITLDGPHRMVTTSGTHKHKWPRERLVRHVPLLAHLAQHTRVRWRSLFRARQERPRGAGARIRPLTFKDYALQGAGTLDGTQMGLEQGAFRGFPLGDHEILVRHFHKTVGDWVDAWTREQAEKSTR